MEKCFTEKTKLIWQNGERILIVVFLATFTFNIRKVFLTPYSYLNGEFNEYLTISFSWADLLMVAVIFIYTIKWLCSQLEKGQASIFTPHNNNTDKSSNTELLRSPQSVLHLFRTTINYFCQVVKRTSLSLPVKHCETFLLTFFLTWIFLSIFWSAYKPIAFYRITNILLIVVFALILIAKLQDKKWLKMALLALLLNGLLQSSLGIAQFINNGSIGLHFIGESIISQDLPGVAKIVIAGGKHIRAYGTLPHPNILAGFLIIPIFIIVSELLERIFEKASADKKVARETILKEIPAGFLTALLFFILIYFSLTFSRSAFLGLGLGLLVLFWLNFDSLIGILKLPNLKKRFFFALFIVLVILILAVFWSLAMKNLLSSKSLAERNFYLNVSREIISKHPLNGTGIGQFVLSEYKKYPDLAGWQYQPVHNIYLLIVSELGMVGLILFLFLILTMLLNCCLMRITDLLQSNSRCCVILLSFLIIFLFDHYFWDIKIGMIIFVLAVAFLKLPGKKPADYKVHPHTNPG